MPTLHDRLQRMKLASAEKIPAEKLAVMARATADLAASGILDRVAEVDTSLPAFSLPDTNGDDVVSAELLADGPLVVSFYRGFW